jgi:hypothetical protein
MTKLLQWKTITITDSKTVFLHLGIHHAMRMYHTVICDIPGSTIFSTLSHKRYD